MCCLCVCRCTSFPKSSWHSRQEHHIYEATSCLSSMPPLGHRGWRCESHHTCSPAEGSATSERFGFLRGADPRLQPLCASRAVGFHSTLHPTWTPKVCGMMASYESGAIILPSLWGLGSHFLFASSEVTLGPNPNQRLGV